MIGFWRPQGVLPLSVHGSASAGPTSSRPGSRDRQGELCAGAQRSHTPAKLAGHDAALCRHVQSAPDTTLAELVQWASTELGICVSIKGMWKRLKALDLTLKKRR